MAIRQIQMKYGVPLTGMAGAGVGLVITELPAEITTRVTGLTGYAKAGAKTLVKGVVGSLLFALSLYAGVRHPTLALGSLSGAFAGWGSIFVDWITALYPGGIPGLAERIAGFLRVYSMGAQRVTPTMARLERTPTVIRTSTAVTGGKY